VQLIDSFVNRFWQVLATLPPESVNHVISTCLLQKKKGIECSKYDFIHSLWKHYKGTEWGPILETVKKEWLDAIAT